MWITIKKVNGQKWSICKILQIKKAEIQIKVYYEGWHKKYDQWIDIKIQQNTKKINKETEEKISNDEAIE